MENLLIKIIYTSGTIFLLGCIVILSILWVFSNELPDYKFLKNYKPPVSSKVYSGAGESLFHLTFDADDVEELQDTTDNYNLEYRVDGILDLNENDRVDILTNDISDTLENDINKQAF